jgi:hypothetical protein
MSLRLPSRYSSGWKSEAHQKHFPVPGVGKMASSEFDRSSAVAKGFLETYSDLFHIMDQGIDGELDVRRGMLLVQSTA